MQLLKNILQTDSKIPLSYRKDKTIEDIMSELISYDFASITNKHVLNLISLLFPKDKKVVSKTYVHSCKTMDLEIDHFTHSYIANGIPVHNTINIPTDLPFEEFKEVYMYAYDQGLKGCTTFRFNPAAFQGVLVKEDDLKNTNYVFNLENGEIIVVSGDTQLEYEGETHSAANLYDAIKEGYYGKF